jgi:hypothetical protein
MRSRGAEVIRYIKSLRSVSSETGYYFKSLSILNRKVPPILFPFLKTFRWGSPLVRFDFHKRLRGQTASDKSAQCKL